MRLSRRLIIAGTALGLAVAAAGGAIAASKLGSPKEESQAVVKDAAKQLGVQPNELSAALKKALSNRVDEAVKAGRLTRAEGEVLKARINSGEFPLFGIPLGPGFAPRPFGLIEPEPLGELSTAADYLGLTAAQLRDQLNSDRTLAQIANDQGKSVDGLIDKLVDRKKERIEAAVRDGRLTRTQANKLLADVNAAVADFVKNARLHLEYGDKEPSFDTRPPGFPDLPPGNGAATMLPAA
ncbi:MAG TPA: hypothetical protein VKB73_03090 [Gaiellaceae bacterium]|nr:hypothetical protein [Gaiellaceae bacterium]